MFAEDDERAALHAEIARLRASEAELKGSLARAEQDRYADRALFEAAIEYLPFDFWARDKDDRCTLQNATARANWGDLRQKRTEDAPLPPHVLETWIANNRRALSGEMVRGDYEYTKDGETRYVSNVLAPLRTEDGIVGTLGVNIDVTDLKRALSALRTSQHKLRMAVDTAGIGIWTWDPARDDVEWDPALSAIFGLPPGISPAGREGYLALVHPDDRQATIAKIAAGTEAGRWEDEYRIVRADGVVRWVLAKGSIASDAEGSRVFGAAIDVTERKERDEQLRQAQKLEAVGQLTAGIAHNFNNMLMGVLPNLELAANRASADLVPLLDSAVDSARRAADLVRKLLTFAGRNQPGAHSIEEVGRLVTRAVDLCRTTFDRRIAFEHTCEVEAHARVNPTQFEQALLNLLINARDALESPRIESPRLSVSVVIVHAEAAEVPGSARDHVRVRVADNGCGMDAATLRRIYEPFFTTKEVGRGTGLGLATTRAIVREHGGFIACDSEKGRGTTFSLYLPLETPPPARAGSASEAPAGGCETVLVVDDEPIVRTAIARMLESDGYAVEQAASGTEALERLGAPDLASRVAVVLLDVSMPGPPRGELRLRLRELTRARVVYLTGYALDEADADPDDTVLEKPVTRAQLLRTIRRELERV